tara:strand:+ start:1270 stop:1584 length:315 start_codon:yes stop_codon:yes gene_type:complete
MARFKIVKHRFSYHVIGYTGIKKPRGNKKSTYKEQCISSHTRLIKGALKRAELARMSYITAKLELSSLSETSVFHKLVKEFHIGLIIAVVCGIMFEAGVKFLSH